jgi:nucleoside-diphosphate-sugar epimerase
MKDLLIRQNISCIILSPWPSFRQQGNPLVKLLKKGKFMQAIVIGATGPVGRNIVEILLKDPSFTQVLVFVRRSSGFIHPKLREHIVNFELINEWSELIKGDILFSALGTTIKQAKSKDVQFQIDHNYQLNVATKASQNGISHLVLISSVVASSSSRIFYLRMKGELEDKISKLSFKSISILRPGPLKGHREKERLGDTVSAKIIGLLPELLVPMSLKFIEGKRVAQLAVIASKDQRPGNHILGPHEIL